MFCCIATLRYLPKQYLQNLEPSEGDIKGDYSESASAYFLNNVKVKVNNMLEHVRTAISFSNKKKIGRLHRCRNNREPSNSCIYIYNKFSVIYEGH